MNGFLILGLLAGVVATTGSAQVAHRAVEQELIKAERELADAFIKRDIAGLERILAEEFIDSNPDGIAQDKASAIAETKSGTVLSVTFSDLKVRMYGDVGIVTGLYTQKAILNGKDATGTNRFTDVFVKRAGRWQLVSTQSTRVAKK